MPRTVLRSGAWRGDGEIELSFPDGWQVERLGEKLPPSLAPDALRRALRRSTGAPPLAELARGRKRAAIVVDDLTRPTPVAELLPAVLEVLFEAGLTPDRIRILVAGGTHERASRADLELKLGREILERHEVIAHDMRYARLEDLGTSPRGVPIRANAALMECDLKIGLGGIYPHPAAGFSGGAKIVAPGACGFETAHTLHDVLAQGDVRGDPCGGVFRAEAEAIARRIGLDFIANVVLNQKREIAALFAGDLVVAHREGVRFARERFVEALPGDADIVVADAYPFDSYLSFALARATWPLLAAARGATRVLLSASPAGLGLHALDLQLGERLRMRLAGLGPAELGRLPQRIRNLRRQLALRRFEYLLWSPGLSGADLAGTPGRAKCFGSWEKLRRELERRRGRRPTRVAVYRCAPLLLPDPGTR